MIDVTLDFETFYDKQYSLKKMTMASYVRDPRFEITGCSYKIEEGDTVWVTPDEIPSMVATLSELECHHGVNLICQNTKFDALILNERLGFTPSYYSDIMSMFKGMYPQFPSDLKFMSEFIFLGNETMAKGTALQNLEGLRYCDMASSQKDALAEYGIQDSDITYAIYQILKPDIPQAELDMINLTTRMYCQPEFVLDIPKLEAVIESQDGIKHNALLDAQKALDDMDLSYEMDEKTFSSNPQYADFLRFLNVDVPTKISPRTGKEAPALGKNDVDYLELKKQHPTLTSFYHARETIKSTIAKSRAQGLINAVQNRHNGDNKLVVPLKYYGAHTGRFGGGEKINLQNLQRGSEHRKALTAPRGKLVYVADSSNIEARMLAWFAGQHDLVDQFRNGEDTYATLASKIYGFEINKKSHPGERSVGKVARLGLGYGMGWSKFQETLLSGPMGMAPIPCDENFAKLVVNTYRRSSPRVVACWNDAQNALFEMMNVHPSGYLGCLHVARESLNLPNGMHLHFPELYGREIEHAYGVDYEVSYKAYDYKTKRFESKKIYGGKLVENICQALATAVIKEQMLKIDQIMQDHFDGQVVLQVHDEIIVIANDKEPDAIMDAMYKVMNTPPEWCADIPLASEGGYDTCYSK